MSEPLPFCFNLWHDPWIRVVQLDGQVSQCSIEGCLTEAHRIVGLFDPSPLVVAGTHRLLVAILQAIFAPESLDEIGEVLSAAQFDTRKLADFADRYAERFALFHPTMPFLQTGDVPLDGWRRPEKVRKGEPKVVHSWGEPKPIASLFDEVPGTTYRALYHHVTDEQHQVCPACCARGLVTIAAFASSGGAGIRPSINGVPPVYVLPAGVSLFETLALSLTTPGYQPAAASPLPTVNVAWDRPAVVVRDEEQPSVSYLESLTFPARRVRLYPLIGAALCTQCGAQTDVFVRQMLFEMGHRRSEGASSWDDPFVAFRVPSGKGAGESGGVVPVRPQEGKALWREYTGLLLLDDDDRFRPKIVRQVSELCDAGVLGDEGMIRFRCIGVRSDGKAKIFEWLDEALEAPPDLLRDRVGIVMVEQALEHAREVERVIGFAFDQHFRPDRAQGKRIDRKVVRFRTLRARMVALFWQELAAGFRQLTRDAADVFSRDAAVVRWRDLVIRVGRNVFNATAEQVGDRADALRVRVQAVDACHRQLRAKRKEWGDE